MDGNAPNVATLNLDIGCGYLPDHKRRRGIGIDLQRGTCDVVADACHLPFQNQAFKRIEARNVLEHIPNPFLLLSEIKRVLAPDGLCVITIPIYHNPCVDELIKLCFGFPFRLATTIKRLLRWKKHRFKRGFWHVNRIKPYDIGTFLNRVVYVKRIQPKHDLIQGRKGRTLKKLGIWAYYPPDVYFLVCTQN